MTTVSAPIVEYEFFHGELRTWDAVFAKAAQVGRERLIGISHARTVVTVWYWGEAVNDTGQASMSRVSRSGS